MSSIATLRALCRRDCSSPRVLDAVAYDRFLACGDLHRELDRACVELFEIVRLLTDRPVDPAVEALLHEHRDRLLLLVAHLDLDLLGHRLARGIDREAHLAPLAD